MKVAFLAICLMICGFCIGFSLVQKNIVPAVLVKGVVSELRDFHITKEGKQRSMIDSIVYSRNVD